MLKTCHIQSHPGDNLESPTQFENRMKPRVYVRRLTLSTMYEKAPFHEHDETELA